MSVFLGINLLIAVIMLLRKVSFGKISGKLRYSMWLSVPIFLVLSLFISLSSPVDLRFAVPDQLRERSSSTAAAGEVQDRAKDLGQASALKNVNAHEASYPVNKSSGEIKDDPGASVSVSGDVVHTAAEEQNTRTIDMIRTVWIAGSAVTFLFFLTVNLIFIARVLRKRVYLRTDDKTGMKLYLYPFIASPFLLFNKIYLHPDITLDDIRTEHAVIHEYCHYKQGDTIWAAVRYIIVSIFWFDPLIWYASSLVCRDCEISCDESVIRIIGEENRIAYGNTLLSFFDKKSRERALFSVSSSLNGQKKSFIRIRIMNIGKKTSRSLITAVIAVAVTACAIGCALTNPFEEKDGGSDPRKGSSESITVETSGSARESVHESAAVIQPNQTYDSIMTGASFDGYTASGYSVIMTPVSDRSFALYAFDDATVYTLELAYPDNGLPDSPDYTSCIFSRVSADDGTILCMNNGIDIKDYYDIAVKDGVICLLSVDEETGNTVIDIIDSSGELTDSFLCDMFLEEGVEITYDGCISAIVSDDDQRSIWSISLAGNHDSIKLRSAGGSDRIVSIGGTVYAARKDSSTLFFTPAERDGANKKIRTYVVKNAGNIYGDFISTDSELLFMSYNGTLYSVTAVSDNEAEFTPICSSWPSDVFVTWPRDMRKDRGRILFAEDKCYTLLFGDIPAEEKPEITPLNDGVYSAHISVSNIREVDGQTFVTFDIYRQSPLPEKYFTEEGTIDLRDYDVGVVKTLAPDKITVTDLEDTVLYGVTYDKAANIFESPTLYALRRQSDGAWYIFSEADTPVDQFFSRSTLPLSDGAKINDYTGDVNAPVTRSGIRDFFSGKNVTLHRYCSVTVKDNKITMIEFMYHP